MLAILRIRGDVGIRHDVRLTFKILKLDNKFTLSVVPDKKETRGQIQTINNYVTWGEISKETLEALKKVPTQGGNNVKFFCLHPPRGGFKKSTKRPTPAGELGYRGDKINKLIMRMLPEGA